MGNKNKEYSEEFIHSLEDQQPSLDLDLEFDMSELEKDFNQQQGDVLPPPPTTDPTEKTFRIVDANTEPPVAPDFDFADLSEEVETKVSFGSPMVPPPPQHDLPDRIVSPSNPTLKQSEHLRIAQNKINALEEEIESLRRELDAVGSAGETFKKINDEYHATIEVLKQKVTDQKTTYSQESALLKKINKSKDKQIQEMRQTNDELKSRLDNNFRNVRNREKDLEHRLEIAKIEEAAVVKSKDQLILDLKRKIDRIQSESENFRQKSQENYKELQGKNQVIRGVVRALRIALTKMEGDYDLDDELGPLTSGNEDEPTT